MVRICSCNARNLPGVFSDLTKNRCFINLLFRLPPAGKICGIVDKIGEM